MDKLTQIREGMMVYGPTGEELGKVKFVKFGDEDLNDPGPETAEVSPAAEGIRDESLVEVIADALVVQPDLPEPLRKRMKRYGFVRLDRGTLKSDGLVALDHIQEVSGDKLTLSASEDAVYVL